MVITKIIYVLLIVLLLVLLFTNNPNRFSIKTSHYTIKNKYFNQSRDLREWLTPNSIAIQEAIQKYKLKGNNKLDTISRCYDFIEKNYHYTEDTNISWTDGAITLYEHQDFWQPPILSLAIMEERGGFYGDCEDGTFLLQSLLEGCGIKNTYACIGEVREKNKIYGHAFVIMEENFKTYVLETTLGVPLKEYKELPAFYTIDVKFDSHSVYMVTGKNLEEVVVHPSLPPGGIDYLRDYFDSH